MFKSLKKVFTLALVSTLCFTACKNSADMVSFENAGAENSTSRAAVKTVRLTSELNPGYGSAVYFTGSFIEGNSWSTAVRGTYDNGWYADVTASSDFEWKALTGSYDLGSSVSVNNGLTWENSANHTVSVSTSESDNYYVLYAPGNPNYGLVAYFTGTFEGADNWSTLVAGTWDYNKQKYFAIVKSESAFEWKYLTGNGNATSFDGLTWCSGANKTAADAVKFADFWSEVYVDYATVQYVESTKTASLFSYGLVEDIYNAYKESDVQVEFYKGDELVWTKPLCISGNSMTLGTFDKHDTSIYTVSVTPVSIFGDMGKANTSQFCPAMVKVAGGTFTMGNDSDAYTDNPEHQVTLTKTLWASKYEVTQKEFIAIMGDNTAKIGDCENRYGDELPAYYVSFPMAIIYCNKKSAAEGLTPVYDIPGFDWESAGYNYNTWWKYDLTPFANTTADYEANGYRLPTEAEWEYLARGNQNYKYAGSDSTENLMMGCGTSGYTTFSEVGTYQANGFGLYDMTGNVCEICFDFYGDYDTSAVTDPTGPATGTTRVARGGGCKLYMNWNYTVYGRNTIYSATSSSYDQGFRVVRNAD